MIFYWRIEIIPLWACLRWLIPVSPSAGSSTECCGHQPRATCSAAKQQVPGLLWGPELGAGTTHISGGPAVAVLLGLSCTCCSAFGPCAFLMTLLYFPQSVICLFAFLFFFFFNVLFLIKLGRFGGRLMPTEKQPRHLHVSGLFLRLIASVVSLGAG